MRSRICRAGVAHPVLLLFVALGFGAAAAAAQRPARPQRDTVRTDTAVIPVGELIVRVARPVATPGGASAIEAPLDSMRLPPSPTLEQVLRQLPLVRVRRNSRGEAQFSLRGSEERQVAVLVDGVPLSLGWDHRADLSVLPASAAQSVTLVRGLPSVLHGPNVLGGVVEVGVAGGRTLSLGRPEPVQATGSVDDVGNRALGVVSAVPFEAAGGDVLLRAGLGWRDQRALAVPSEISRPGLVAGGELANSDVEQADGFLALRYGRPNGGWLSLSASGFTAERGVLPELHLERPRFWRYPESSRFLAAITGGTGERETPFGEGDLEASIGVDLGRTHIDSYESEAFTRVVGREEGDDRVVTLRLLAEHALSRSLELRSAVTYADIDHEERLEPGGAASYRQRLWSLGGEIAGRLFRGGPRVSAGGAIDVADTPESGDKPPLERITAWGARVGANTSAAEGAVLLNAGVSRRARFPSLRELYSGSLGRFEPNPTLRPELLTAAEAGATGRIGAVELQGVAFLHRLEDAIVRASAAGGRFRRENRDRIRSAGVELLAGWRRGESSVSGEATLQDVTVHDPSAPAGERRAEYQPSWDGRLEGAATLPFRVRGGATLKATGRQWCVHPERSDDMSLEPSAGLDLDASRTWSFGARRADGSPSFGRVETSLALANATDAAIYDQCGIPRAGRTLELRVRVW